MKIDNSTASPPSPEAMFAHNAFRFTIKAAAAGNANDLAEAEELVCKHHANAVDPPEPDGILPMSIEVSAPDGGFHRNEVTRLLLAYGHAANAAAVPLALKFRIEDSAFQEQTEPPPAHREKRIKRVRHNAHLQRRQTMADVIGELGTIHPVALRTLWPGEATHFTPWLSKNLDRLGSKLGMDLELQSIESSAGDFSADLVVKDLSSTKLVVIENQFGSTDHRHLGQLLTYASFLNAGAVVWIAETIRPEHKSVVDFLNLNLKGTLSFYAVEASAIRIDQSPPAFLLNVVSAPNEAAATAKTDGPSGNSETGERYRVYFQALIDELREKHRFTNARVGQAQNWYTFASENSKVFKYSTSFSQNGVRVEIYLDKGDKEENEALFDCLKARKAEIETGLGYELSWEKLETKRACRVAVYRDASIDDDSETLMATQAWTIQNLLKFKKVFPSFIAHCAGAVHA